MSRKKFELKKCQCCRQEFWKLSGLKFVADKKHYCSYCLEKQGDFKCRWCHKILNPNRYSDGLGKVNFIFDGGILNGHGVDVSTVCCINCLWQIEKKRGVSNNGGWKKCETSNCRYTLSPNEEAVGRKECISCEEEKKKQENRKKAKEHEGEFEKYKQAQQKAQSWWNTLSPYEWEQECERVVENMKQEKYWFNEVREGSGSGWACDGSLWSIKNGKLTSSSPHLVPIQIVEEFGEKEIGFRDNKAIEWFSSQVVKVKKESNDDNLPIEAEDGERDSEKKIKLINNNKSGNGVLTINLKRVKKITLRNDGKLEIMFNGIQNKQNGGHCYSIEQVVSDEQVDNNQELKAVRNYLRENGKDSLNHQELTKFFDSSLAPTETPKDTNTFLWIGGIAFLGFGLLAWLLARKRNWEKH